MEAPCMATETYRVYEDGMLFRTMCLLFDSVRQKTEEPGILEKICAKLSCSRAEVPTSL